MSGVKMRARRMWCCLDVSEFLTFGWRVRSEYPSFVTTSVCSPSSTFSMARTSLYSASGSFDFVMPTSRPSSQTWAPTGCVHTSIRPITFDRRNSSDAEAPLSIVTVFVAVP